MIVRVCASANASLGVTARCIADYLRAHRLDSAAAVAVAKSEPVLLRAGLAGLTKRVAVQALEPVYAPNRVVIAIRWLATGKADQLYPALDANFELFAAGGARTELVLVGAYRPPFGRVGVAIDQLLMRRVAEATLRRFTTAVAAMVDATTVPNAPNVESGPDLEFDAGA